MRLRKTHAVAVNDWVRVKIYLKIRGRVRVSQVRVKAWVNPS